MLDSLPMRINPHMSPTPKRGTKASLACASGSCALLGCRVTTALGTVLLLAAGLLAAEPREGPAVQAEGEHVAGLIVQLGSRRFDEREAATHDLAALGPAALEPLRQALLSSDAEVRRRAGQLVRTIERRLEAARILEATRGRLVYRDTPLTQAVADFVQRTGLPIQLEGARSKLAERKITLDTGDTTLWQALDSFCQKAGLSERLINPASILEAQYRDDPRDARVIAMDDIPGDLAGRQENRLVLSEGGPQPLPTCQVGAFRVRVRAIGARLVAGQSRAERETLFGLEIRLEPRLRLQSVLAVRIDRVVDPQGHTLPLPENTIAWAGAYTEGSLPPIVIQWDGATEIPANFASGVGQVPVRLRLPDLASRRLKELHGTIALQVQTAAERLASVEHILQATGQTVKGDDGSSIKLIDVQREANRQVKLRLEVASPPQDLFIGGVPVRILLVPGGWFRGGRGIAVPLPIGADQFALLDNRGQPVRRVSSTGPTVSGNGTTWEFTQVFQPGPSQEEPARLIYTGQRSPTIEVAFTLKDVPLP
jgi:hypothetical protein